MDWKEQLSTLLEGEMQTLDVRLICIKNEGKWFLRRLRAIVFHSEPSIPEQISYPSYLFLREKMSSLDFLQLIHNLTSRSNLSQEELNKLSYEEKLKKFTFKEWEIFYELVNVYLRNHSQGSSHWGLGDYALPSWNFDGNLQPFLQENQEPLIATEVPYYFPRAIDGEAWYLYEKALQSSNDSLPDIEISIEDDRAFFSGIDIEEDTSIVRCRCGGKLLPQSSIQLYTSYPQVESEQAEGEIVFQLQGQLTIISLALTYADTWLDKRDINLLYGQLGIPKDVNIIVPNDNSATLTFREEIANMIATKGENMILEFKSRLDEGEGIDKNRLLQTVVAFANTSGGTILLGVANDGQVLGLDPSDTKDTLVRKIDGNVSPVPYFEVIPQEQEGKPILVIRVREGTIKPCALMVNKNKPQFYVRMDGSNKLAKPEDIWQMCGQQGRGSTNDPMSLFRQPYIGQIEGKRKGFPTRL